MIITEKTLRKAINVFLSCKKKLSEDVARKTRQYGYMGSGRSAQEEEEATSIEGLADPGSFSGVSPAGLELIMKEEGFRPFVYDDLNSKVPLASYESSRGTPTIGVGHAIQSGPDRQRFRKYLKGGSRMSKEEGR